MNGVNQTFIELRIQRSQVAKLGKIAMVVAFFVVALTIIWVALKDFQSISIPFLLGGLLAFLLGPRVDALERKGYSRTRATLLVFLLLLIFLGLILWFLIPLIIEQVQTIQDHFKGDAFEQRLEILLQNVQDQFSFLGSAFSIEELQPKLKVFIDSFRARLLSFALAMVSAISTIVVIPFIAFFLLKDGPAMKKKFISLIPNRYFEMSLNLLYQIERPLGGYIRGQLIDAFIIGVLSIIALALIGVDYYFIIGALAGLANMIPYFGPIVGAVPAILVSLLGTPSLTPVLWIIVAFAVIQLIDNVVISPLVVARSAEIHPLLVIIVIFLGEHFLGVLGMLLAVPITAILQVVIRETIWSFRNYKLL